jgi:hypothetical protein
MIIEAANKRLNNFKFCEFFVQNSAILNINNNVHAYKITVCESLQLLSTY